MKSNNLVLTEADLHFATPAAAETPAQSPVRPFARELAADARFAPVITLVLWTSCSLIGVLGFAMPYSRPLTAKAQPEPMQVEMLNVELASEPMPDLAPPVVNSLATPPPAEALAQPQLPPAMAVALPSPAVAFAVPVEGATRIVAAAQASYNTSAAIQNDAVASAALPVQTLTYGQGAGKQPAPEYPWRAQSEGQEGVVNVRFTVAESGRVISAEAVNPSPWPLLNDSAVRTVRNRWRFNAGTSRAYEVAIRFVLPKERS
jgi:TonB family protein